MPPPFQKRITTQGGETFKEQVYLNDVDAQDLPRTIGSSIVVAFASSFAGRCRPFGTWLATLVAFAPCSVYVCPQSKAHLKGCVSDVAGSVLGSSSTPHHEELPGCTRLSSAHSRLKGMAAQSRISAQRTSPRFVRDESGKFKLCDWWCAQRETVRCAARDVKPPLRPRYVYVTSYARNT